MAAIVFPANPNVNETFVVGDVTWRWDGTSWVSNSTFNGRMPVGATEQRPTDPKIGMIRYNTTLNLFEGYDDSGWRPFQENPIRRPFGISPAANEEIETGTTFTLVASDYVSFVELNHASSDWQIASDLTFADPIVENLEDAVNLTSYTISGGVSETGILYWRVRYRDTIGNESNWSIPQTFDSFEQPPELGDSFCGGFYIGTTCANSTEYYLIVAPNATGCAECQWKTTATATAGTSSTTDGFSNTYGPLDNAEHPAGNWTATRTINGFSDWYLPAIDELNVLYVNDGGSTNTTLPSGEGFAAVSYWSSTEGSAAVACVQFFSNGLQYGLSKPSSRRVRAVRREPI